jgi:hypothetical protein
MKTKTKSILLGLGIAMLGGFTAQAQGLQNVIVEKYYLTDAADATNAANNSAASALNVGSVAYRVYVDMAPGYKLNAVFGSAIHPWKISTTTNFYNDPNNGVAIGPQANSLVNTKKNTVLIDSWLTMGGTAVGKVGVQKIEDVDGSVGNSNGVLMNNPGGVYGVAINSVIVGAQDGMAPGAPSAVTAVGFNNGEESLFDQTPGNSFLVNNHSIASLSGVVGTTTTNAVLIGQFTTDGTLGFELNVQVQNTVTGIPENWVANNPQAGEFTLGALTLAPPLVGITAPINGANVITGNNVAITATATAAAGIASVQFFVDGVSAGTDLSSPYTANYLAVTGSHTITAVATDNNTNTATSSAVIITAAANQAPNVTVASPASALVNQVVTFTATANDVDGTVASVTFSVDGVAIGTVTNSPYTFTWTAAPFGNHVVRASATDNLGLAGLSAPVNINVVPNILPSVSISAPLNNSSVIAPQVVTITATATDADGTIALVEAFVNNVSVGTSTAAGPNYVFTYATSTLSALDVIKVVATDNSAGSSTSTPVSVNVANPNALPYEIGTVKEQCNQGNFCLPISVALTYTVDNVIGYDIVLNYDAARVTPTGSITVNPALITPSFVTVINSFGSGTMNISAFFNINAPVNAEWNGTGDLFCVGFVKNSMTSVDTAVYTIASLQESYFNGVTPKTASAGKYVTYRDTTFDANLRFWKDNSPMRYNSNNQAAYLITNIYGTNASCVPTNTNIAVNPDLNGHFTYNILNGSSISISRDIAALTSVQSAINANDYNIGTAVLLNVATGSLTPSVYQFIALDVNLDGVVSAGDLTQINQRSVDFIPEFKQVWNYNAIGTNTLGMPSRDYIFVDSLTVLNNPAYQISATYPANDLVGYSKAKVPNTILTAPYFCLTVPQSSIASCPTIDNAVFRGIMVGDADGNSATESNTFAVQVRSANSDKVVVDLSKGIFNGNSVEVPVSFVSSVPVNGLDFAMKYDESALSFNTMVNYPANTNVMSYMNPNSKTLRSTFSSLNLSAFDAEKAVAYIRFETKNGEIDENQFNSLVGYLNGKAVPMEVVNRTVGINATSADNSVNIYPNPTNGIINVTSISDATVQLFDLTGKVVLMQTTVSASKTQEINVSNFVNGVYMLKISSNDFVTIKKVVLNK